MASRRLRITSKLLPYSTSDFDSHPPLALPPSLVVWPADRCRWIGASEASTKKVAHTVTDTSRFDSSHGRLPARPDAATKAAAPATTTPTIRKRLPARCCFFQHLRRRSSSGPLADNDLVRCAASVQSGRAHQHNVVDHVGHVGNASIATPAAAARGRLPIPPSSTASQRRRSGIRILSGPAALGIGWPASAIAPVYPAATAGAPPIPRQSAYAAARATPI